ncbi:MAG TPA: TonB-dependent receptor [Saprospiraceae bacterium]|nr:TonB-dependent receptor [Saprospiraceae bacterium]
MKKHFITILLLAVSHLISGQNYTLSGYVSDASNGESLIGASVYVKDSNQGATSNSYGFYSLTLPPGDYTVVFSYLGFQDQSTTINLDQNKSLNTRLAIENNLIDEVVVTAESEDKNVRDLQMSVNKLDIKTIQKVPTLLGETEIIRSIQLLPGVTTVGEGAAGFNVRGGSIDQNLVLLDEAPVYNSSHLFGFFSVSNPDAVKDVQLYKGGIPARYGGRLSSILDVRMKEGNNQKFTMNGGVGTIFSRLALEAPIVKDKSSFIVAGRRSYIDVLAAPFLSGDFDGTVLNFYDLTLKSNFKFNDNNQLFASGYFGRDNFGFGDRAGFNWGNKTGTLRFNHLFSEKLFSNVTAYFSDYDYKINFGDSAEDKFDWNARIKNYSLKLDFNYFLNPDNILRFGGQSIFYEFQPANAIAISNDFPIDISLDSKYALESNIFIENEFKPSSALEVNAGLRLSHFNYLGKGTAYYYGDAPELGKEKPILGEEYFESGKSIQQYVNLEPRLAVKYQLNKLSSIKASYNRTTQYIHLISNTTASTPVDVWTPSTNNIKPQIADQIAAGYFRNFSNNQYELSTELYYKNMAHLVDYIDGADLILNKYLEGQILEGVGRAYGMEVQLKKNEGKFSGWLSYTLARTERKVEGINNGDWYPSRFDQLHNFSMTGFYELSKRWTFSANFVLNTGTPTTFPTSRYEQQGYVIPNNDDNLRNNVRIPAYHRLDISFTLDSDPNSTKRWKGQWVFGVYNLYNRRNPFSIYFKQSDGRVAPGLPVNTEAIQFAVVGSFVPSISYNFKF